MAQAAYKNPPGQKITGAFNGLALTEEIIRQAQPSKTVYYLEDGDGLLLEVGLKRKRWKLRYDFQGKEKISSLGVYPNVTLEAAREKKIKAFEAAKAGLSLRCLQTKRDAIYHDEPAKVLYSAGREDELKDSVENVPYLVAYQQGGRRYLVYLESETPRQCEIVHTGSLDIRPMTPQEITGAVAHVRKTLPKNELAKVDALLPQPLPAAAMVLKAC